MVIRSSVNGPTDCFCATAIVKNGAVNMGVYPHDGKFSPTKRNEVPTCATTWVNLEKVLLSEKRQKQKAT